MTAGTAMFYGGVALLALTVILAAIFLIKKPKYTPESEVYESGMTGTTQKLRNAYPTDRMTIRRDKPEQATELISSDAPVADQKTELLSDALQTELLQNDTEILPQSKPTELLDQDK